MTAWYTDDPWKVYAGWLSPDWALPREGFDPAAWCDGLVRAGFRSMIVHAKHHDGICFFPTRFRAAPPPRDYFGDLTTAARERGMRVIAYYSTLFDSVTAWERPDLACRERDGSITQLRWPPFPMGVCCHNHPGYRELLLGQLRELQDRYDTDGFWMDGFDYTGYPSHACYCRWCADLYARATGGASLADAGLGEDVKLWQRDVFLDLLREIRAIADEGRGDRVVAYNASGTSLEHGYEELDRLCSLLTCEGHSPLHKSVFCRMLASQGRPYEIYTPNSDRVFSWTPRTHAVLEMEAAIVRAHAGTVLVGLDITTAGHIPPWQLDQLRDVRAAIARTDAEITGARPVYDIGLFMPKDDWKREDGGWHQLMLRSHLPFALLPLHATDLAPYRVIVLASGFVPAGPVADALCAFVHAGGSLIVEHTAAQSPALAGLLGVIVHPDAGYDIAYVDAIEPSLRAGLWDEPVRADGGFLELELTGARALARYALPVAVYSRERWVWREPNPPRRTVSSAPAAAIHEVGAGRVVVLASALGALKPTSRQYARFCGNILESVYREPLLRSEAPSGVEVVVARRDGPDGPRYMVHFLNHALYDSALYDRPDAPVPAFADVTVWVNERRVGPVCGLRRLVSGTSAPAERDAGWTRVTVPALAAHETVVLEPQSL